MIKYLILFVNLITYSIYSFLFLQDVSVKPTVPASVKAGEEFTVELKVTKNEIAGFAKLQHTLPAGFSATAVETQGGTFSFTDQNVKIIWMSLPADKEFVVKYSVKAEASAAGTHTLEGKFSYIENNEKMVAVIDPVTLTVASDAPVAATTTATEKTTPPTTADTSKPVAAKTPEPATAQPATETNAAGQPNIKRTIQPGADDSELIVELAVQRADITGFAKIEETLPDGVSATGLETRNSVFTFADQKAKFLWMNLPADNEFKVSYKLKVASGTAREGLKVEGLFSYLINDVTQKYVIAADAIPAAGAATVTAKTETPSSQPAETKTETEKTTPAEPAAVAKTAEPGVGSPEKGVNFRVQISATHKNVPTTYFTDKHRITEKIFAEMHEGWHKFTIGGFPEYKSARDKREQVRTSNNVPGPFVTAYNNGARITVQEALMIANQKWVK